jgi:CBS domain-containing protein
MQVHELMTKHPGSVTPNATVRQAAEMMRDHDIGIVPVVRSIESAEVVGVITDRDIAVRHVAAGHSADCAVLDHMSRDPHTVKHDESHSDVMRVMRSEKVRRVPVVDHAERLVGVVSQADLAVDLGPRHRSAVEETVEEISQPAEPRRVPR